MLKKLLILLALWLQVSAGVTALEQKSALWGARGELWSPGSRLPDFSLAGYASGQASIPDYPVLTNVNEHGAKGDGLTDADNGVIMGGSRFCTVDGIITRAVKRTGLTGHHALWVTGRTQDSLFLRFRLETTFVHDLTVEGFSNGNVFTKGSGVSINCDHHRNAPYENLFTDFDAGDPRRLFESSGRQDRGPHSGARTTFWAIRGHGTFPKLPPARDWPLINVVGFGNFAPAQDPDGPWVEPADQRITPANLWEAQIKRRAGE